MRACVCACVLACVRACFKLEEEEAAFRGTEGPGEEVEEEEEQEEEEDFQKKAESNGSGFFSFSNVCCIEVY